MDFACLPRMITEPLGHTHIPATQVDDFVVCFVVMVLSGLYFTKGSLWSRPDAHSYKLFERPQRHLLSKNVTPKTRSIGQLLQQSASDIIVLWASQSGTAERFAGRLSKEITRSFDAKSLSIDVSEIDPQTLRQVTPNKLIIFIASTFGEGDPSDNMTECWSWLNRREDSGLSGLRFIAFGLGNSNYKYYNHVVDTLEEGLCARGAQRLLPTGKADDALGDTEEHFLDWKLHVFDMLQKNLDFRLRDDVSYEPLIQATFDQSLSAKDLHSGIPSTSMDSAKSMINPLPVIRSENLFANGETRKCLHIELGIQRISLRYKTGDHLAIWPTNPDDEVERLVQVLGLQDKRGIPLVIKALDETPVKIPTPTTVNALFRHYLEICALPSREDIQTLAKIAPSDEARLHLQHVSVSKHNYDMYLEKQHVTLGRLLERTGIWDRIPLSLVVELLRPLQPRLYSISSSSVVQPHCISLTAAVAGSQVAGSGQTVPGLTTNYMLSVEPRGSEEPQRMRTRGQPSLQSYQHLQSGYIYAEVRRSSFKLPASASAPIIMVGAGTGVAPFRAFVQERARLASAGSDVGMTKLFFGCRDPKVDFIYRSDFEESKSELKDRFSLTAAFSRPGDIAQKAYVQDKIAEDAEEIAKLLFLKNAYFYICGSATMARDVIKTVESLLNGRYGLTEESVLAFTQTQRKTKRWQQDVWG